MRITTELSCELQRVGCSVLLSTLIYKSLLNVAVHILILLTLIRTIIDPVPDFILLSLTPPDK